MANRAGQIGIDDARVLVVHDYRWGHVIWVLVMAEEAGCRLCFSSGCGLLQEARSMDVPSFLV